MDVFSNLVDDTSPVPKPGDRIKWWGRYINGYQSGTNKVISIYKEGCFHMMKLDNNKEIIIRYFGKNATLRRQLKRNWEYA